MKEVLLQHEIEQFSGVERVGHLLSLHDYGGNREKNNRVYHS